MPDHSIIPARLAIAAMRDSGYKNTAYALAELIDNAIEAEASNVKIVVFESSEDNARKLTEIAVIDDGLGMNPDILRDALKFGSGTRLNSRTTIGRFGMGLPNASISQSSKTEVYTWQNGETNSMYSYLDVERIKQGESEVPAPVLMQIPEVYKQYVASSPSGTLVIWSELDKRRITWKRGSTLAKNAREIVGRTYRNFINSSKNISIVFYIVRDGEVEEIETKPVDPLYLMCNTSTPEPFDQEPMFELFREEEYKIDLWEYGEHKVRLRFSIAKEATYASENLGDKKDRGNTKYGKHAAHNIGLSIVRAGRELTLDKTWCTEESPRNRWWGASIEFEPHLDEFFGVSNNKQSAHKLENFSGFKLDDEVPEDMGKLEYLSQLEEEQNPNYEMIKLHARIHQGIQEVYKEVRKQRTGARGTGSEEDNVDKAGTKAIEERSKDKPILSDSKEPKEHKEEIGKILEDMDVPTNELDNIVRNNLRVKFIEKALDIPAFFQVIDTEAGVFLLAINTNHPFYTRLSEIIAPQTDEDTTSEALLSRLKDCRDAFKLLLCAFARMEQEYSGEVRAQIAEVRHEWGKVARYFFREE